MTVSCLQRSRLWSKKCRHAGRVGFRPLGNTMAVCDNKDVRNKVAVVTGSSQGLGYAVVRELCLRQVTSVYATGPDIGRVRNAVTRLHEQGCTAMYHQLDVTSEASVARFAEHLQHSHGGLDLLVNNAGVMDLGVVYPDLAGAVRNIDVNYRGLLRIERALLPLVRPHGRVVNISSACGHLSNLKNRKWIERLQDKDLTVETIDQFVDEYLQSVRDRTFRREDFADDGKHAEHRVSKVALTALTMVWARNYANRSISVNCVHPGHMRTAMARGGGVLPADHSARLVVHLLLDAPPTLTGAFLWHDRSPVDWTDHRQPLYYKHEDVALT